MNEQFITSSALNSGNSNGETLTGAGATVASLLGMSNAESTTYSGL